MVAVGRRGRRRKRRDAPAAAAGRRTGCASSSPGGAGAAGPTRWSGECVGWESAEGWGWMSASQPPQAGTEERWGAKRREGEKWEVERGRGREIGEGVRWRKYGEAGQATTGELF